MATIASLAVQLVADPSRFVAGLKVAERAMQRLSSSGLNPGTWARLASTGLGKLHGAVDSVLGPVKGLVTQIPFIGPALASIPTSAAGIVQWFQEGAARINEMRVNSLKLGIPLERMAGFMLAGGSASEALVMSMFRLQEELGQAANKAVGTEVTFSRLGLNAKELAVLPLDEAFGRIADRLNSLGSTAARGLAVFSIFGKRGAELMPILAGGSARLAEFQRRAQEMGLSVSSVDAANVLRATQAIKQLDVWMNAAKQSVAVELTPVVIALAGEFQGAGVSAKSMGQAALDTVKVIAYGGAAAVEAWQGLKVLWAALKYDIMKLEMAFAQSMQRMMELAAELPESMGGGKFRQSALEFKIKVDLLRDAMERLDVEGRDAAGHVGDAWNGVGKFFDALEMKILAQRAAAAKAAAQAAQDQAQRAHFERLFNLFERGQKLTMDMLTPLQKFNLELMQLDELANAGAITWDTYARAVGKAGEQLGHVGQLKLAASAEFGSQAAYATVAQKQLTEQRADPLVRLQDLIQAQTAIQQRQERDLDIIARAVRGGMFRVG